MLAEKYLPAYHFRIYHEVPINNRSADLHYITQNLGIDHWLIRLLFRLRGIKLPNKKGNLAEMGFTLLQELPGEEIAYGILGLNPYFSSCVKDFSSSEFIEKYNKGYLKGLIVFGIKTENLKTRMFTETRVHCGSRKIYNRFRIYWFFVKPFSSLIRKILLRSIAKRINK